MRFKIHSFDTLPSTQILAHEWCENDQAKIGDVISAGQQTSGYGRRGRVWSSPVGNLSFTLIEDFSDRSVLSWLSYAMGLGLYDAVKSFLPDTADLKLKWPNDLLLDGAKLSGLLLEVVDDRILIGVGVNVAEAPESDQKVTALKNYSDVRAAELLERILNCYDRWYQIGSTQSFSGLREDWLSKAAFKGEIIAAKLANNQIFQGVFIDLDPQGALALQTEQGRKSITSADIYLPENHDTNQTSPR